MVINHLRGIDFSWKVEAILSYAMFLAITIEDVSWEYVSRTGNCCAVWVAKNAMQGLYPTNWVSRPPPQLSRFFKLGFRDVCELIIIFLE